MTTYSDESSQAPVSPLGPAVPRHQPSDRARLTRDSPPAPPFSRRAQTGHEPTPIEATEPAPEDSESVDIEPPLLIEESLDLEGYDELAWLTDIPEPDEAAGSYDVDEALESSTDEEQPSAEWLNWLDVVEEEQTEEPTSTEPTVTAEQEIAEAEAQEEDEQARDVVEAGIPEGEKPEEPVETVTPEISDADPLVEVAERLERIAAALRDGSAGTLLSEPSTDPLAALVAGYALGYARRRGQGSSGE